ncbi:MAG: hypothetical protein H6722_24360 [Sandaracinus sp.]|nr:hypothetical protein [Sandaracinus sp.]
MKDDNASGSFGEAVEWMMRRFRSSGEIVRGAAAAGALVLASGQVLSGCATEVASSAEAELINSNVRSWAQERGTRTTHMIRYDQKYWTQVTGCGFRGGCTDYEFFIQLFVQPVQGGNLDDKKVGVVYRLPGYHAPQTANGYYVRTFDDGREEWHVPVRVRSWEGSLITFDAWYEDGTWYFDEGAGEWRKRTWVDDNGGDLYPAAMGPWSILSRFWTPESGVTVGEDGVQGLLDFRVANLDWDKEVAMVWSTDGWQTSHWSGQGAGPNQFRFVNPLGSILDGQHDFEHWRIELDIPGPVQRFEYAIVYRHGFAEGATPSEVWDNNGGRNYVIEAQPLF